MSRPHVERCDRLSNTDSVRTISNEITKSCNRGKSRERTHQASQCHNGSKVRIARMIVANRNIVDIKESQPRLIKQSLDVVCNLKDARKRNSPAACFVRMVVPTEDRKQTLTELLLNVALAKISDWHRSSNFFIVDIVSPLRFHSVSLSLNQFDPITLACSFRDSIKINTHIFFGRYQFELIFHGTFAGARWFIDPQHA